MSSCRRGVWVFTSYLLCFDLSSWLCFVEPRCIFSLLLEYFHRFGDKTSCYSDLAPYLRLIGSSKKHIVSGGQYVHCNSSSFTRHHSLFTFPGFPQITSVSDLSFVSPFTNGRYLLKSMCCFCRYFIILNQCLWLYFTVYWNVKKFITNGKWWRLQFCSCKFFLALSYHGRTKLLL